MPSSDHVDVRACRQAIISFVLTLCISPALLAQKVKSDYDKAADFTGFKTYAWIAGTPAPNPNVDMYIKMIVNQDFKKKGLLEVEPKEADLLIAYHAASVGELSMGGFNDPTYAASGGMATPGTTMWSSGSMAGSVGSSVRKGTLAIQMYDRRQRKVIWAASANDTVKEKRTERIDQLDKALSKMLARYPPSKK
jgi:hypothetical protein